MPTPPKKRRSRTEDRAVKAALEATLAEEKPRVRKTTSKPYDKMAQELRRGKRGPRKWCPGYNIAGKPCQSPVLKDDTIIDGKGVSGTMCLFHELASRGGDSWKRFTQLKNGSIREEAPLVNPLQLMAQAIAKAPQILFEPHLRAIGMKWNPDTKEIEQDYDSRGRPKVGAVIYGFSRDGDAKFTRHADVGLQMRATEYLKDRIFGKPRQSVEVAGDGIAMTSVVIPMNAERASAVTVILQAAGALGEEPNAGNDTDADAES